MQTITFDYNSRGRHCN